MLQRRNWMQGPAKGADGCRSDWLREHPPTEFVLPQRIPFLGAARPTRAATAGTCGRRCRECTARRHSDGRRSMRSRVRRGPRLLGRGSCSRDLPQSTECDLFEAPECQGGAVRPTRRHSHAPRS
jgi:hypothetical protein